MRRGCWLTRRRSENSRKPRYLMPMKTNRVVLLALLGSAPLLAMAGTSAPRLLGVATPAEEAVPGPEIEVLQALSDDGRWLLITSTRDRLKTNDLNAASDVFLIDCASGTATLISTAGGDVPGNGTSIGAGMSGDAHRIGFLSRATNLVSPDTNGTWDVFIRDMPAGPTSMASLAADGGNSAGPASEALISVDGRYVVFRSPARDLAPGAFLAGCNLYRRDLAEGRTECLTTNLPTPLQATWRLTAWTATPDAKVVAVTANTVSGAIAANLVAWLDLANGQSVNCSDLLPPEVPSRLVVTFDVPALSGDGRFLVFRASWLQRSGVIENALCLCNVAQGTTSLLAFRTNAADRSAVTASPFRATLDSHGQYVAYSAPLPTYDSSAGITTNGLAQVYFFERATGATRMVSVGPDGVTPANADCTDVQMTPDGRMVLFVSRATNLLPDVVTEAARLFVWNRETGTLQVVAELNDGDSPGQFVVSPNGAWVAVLGREAGVPAIHCLNTIEGTVARVPFPVAVEASQSGRGWVSVTPDGVSADGRYVALMAFPPGSVGRTNHMQIYLLDTHTGARQLMTQGVDGNLPFFHPTLPVLSPDGTQLLFASAATNLVADDTNGLSDVIIQTIGSGARTLLRGAPIPIDATPYVFGPISPDGHFAFVSFWKAGETNLYLVGLTSGQISAAVPGRPTGLPSFSQTGGKVAVGMSQKSGASSSVYVYDAGAWLEAGNTPPTPLWVSSANGCDPVLSADGSRLAYLYVQTTGTNAVVVADWARDQFVFSKELGPLPPSSLAFSADGRFVTWISRGSVSNTVNHVWRADVNDGTVELVSVAADGTSEANGNCRFATMSPDGRFVAFASLANNLVPDDTNNAMDIFLRDMVNRRTMLLSRTPAGAPGGGWSVRPFFSADGRSLFFLSHAPDLAPGDYNQAVDLFKVEIVTDSPILILIQRNLSNGQSTLRWQGAPEKTYQVQFKNDLFDKDWVTLPGSFTGDGWVNIDTTANVHQFFRVVEAP